VQYQVGKSRFGFAKTRLTGDQFTVKIIRLVAIHNRVKYF
jgi:hypothetical protein